MVLSTNGRTLHTGRRVSDWIAIEIRDTEVCCGFEVPKPIYDHHHSVHYQGGWVVYRTDGRCFGKLVLSMQVKMFIKNLAVLQGYNIKVVQWRTVAHRNRVHVSFR